MHADHMEDDITNRTWARELRGEGWNKDKPQRKQEREEDSLFLPPVILQMKILSLEVCSRMTSHSRLASGLGLEVRLLFLRKWQLTFICWFEITCSVTLAGSSTCTVVCGFKVRIGCLGWSYYEDHSPRLKHTNLAWRVWWLWALKMVLLLLFLMVRHSYLKFMKYFLIWDVIWSFQ